MQGTAGTASRYAAMSDRELDREIEAIARALAEGGPVSPEELARVVGARAWGPRRFHAALRQAVLEGRARRVAGGQYGPSGSA
jgi:hypothetical protein